MLTRHVDSGEVVTLDQFRDSSRFGATELVEALPGVADQRDGQARFNGTFNDRDVQRVHVKRFVHNEVTEAASETLADRGVKPWIARSVHGVIEDVPDVRMRAVALGDCVPQVVAVDKRRTGRTNGRLGSPRDQDALLIESEAEALLRRRARLPSRSDAMPDESSGTSGTVPRPGHAMRSRWIRYLRTRRWISSNVLTRLGHCT